MTSKNRSSVRTAQAGFTLIEIMVVIVILGLLATLVVPNIIGASDEARATKAQTDCKNIYDAVRLYRAQKGKNPESLEALAEPDDKGRHYIDNLPKDPWGNDYQLRETDKRGVYKVISYGPDGAEDTEDDISSEAKKDN